MNAITCCLPSVEALLAMCVIVCCASIVQASLGMGYGLTAAPLLALVDPVFVPVPTIFIGLLTSSAGAWSERQKIQWEEVVRASLGRMGGASVAAVLMFMALDESTFLVVFGVAVGLAVLLSVCNFAIVKTTSTLCTMGAVSGLMGTLTGVGAPPLALLYQHTSAVEARPTLAAIFAVGCGFSLLVLAAIGWVGTTELVLAAIMLLPMIAGTVLGRTLRHRLVGIYRNAMLTIAGVASVMLIVRGFFQMTRF